MFRGEAAVMTTAEDPRQTMIRAAELAGRVLETVPTTAHQDPTPCTEWTVGDLIGHLVAVTRRVAHIARGGYPFELPTLLTPNPTGVSPRPTSPASTVSAPRGPTTPC